MFANWVNIADKENWGAPTGLTSGTTVAVRESTSAPWSSPKSSRMSRSDTVADEVDGTNEVGGGGGTVDGGGVVEGGQMLINSEGSIRGSS